MKPNIHDEAVSETDDQHQDSHYDRPQPDAYHAAHFLEWLHGSDPDGMIYVYRSRRVPDRNDPKLQKDDTITAAFTSPAKINSTWWRDYAPRFAQTFAVGTIRDEAKRNQAENIVSYSVVWCDIDACKKLGIPGGEFFNELRDGDDKNPTCRVRSSENGIQLYFQLDEPLRAEVGEKVFDRELKSLLIDIAYYYVGDFKVVLPSALMRLPGSFNIKQEYATPFPVRAYWDPNADQRKYSLTQLREKFNGVGAKTVPKVIFYAIVRAIADIYREGSRNELAMHLAGTVRGAGMDLAGCRGLLKEMRRALGDDSDRADQVESTYNHERPKTLAQDYPEIHAQITKAVELWVEMKEEYNKKVGKTWDRPKKASQSTGGAEGEADASALHHDYEETPHGLFVRKENKNGPYIDPLATFTARIEAEVSEEDGASTLRVYEIALHCNGKTYPCSVPTDEYEAMKWVAQQTTSKAVILPPRANKDEVVAAIKLLSDPKHRIVRTHTGWAGIGGKWFYCHAGGVIGGEGVEDPGIEARLTGALEAYRLPSPPNGADLIVAVRTTLDMLKVGADRIIFPALAAGFRAALGPSDFAVALVGASGVFKSEVAGLVQRLYGPTMDGRRLPGSWSSTENALESVAFSLKDALFTIDDFAPSGSPQDVNRLHAKAERLIRAQGNNSGRQRANRDGTAQIARPPRGLILSTGEDIPRGHSLRGRTYVIEVGPGDIVPDQLTLCQSAAGSGIYSQAMSGFLAHLAPHYGDILRDLPEKVRELRDTLQSETGHRRTPEIVANLVVGLRYFLNFACEVGAITEKESNQLYKRGYSAIESGAQEQAAHQQEAEPTQRFLELLGAAVAGGKGHVADTHGDAPDNATAHGWRCIKSEEYDGFESAIWQQQGDLIGWVDGEDLYLNMEAAYKCAQQMGRESNNLLATSVGQLSKRLVDKGLVLSTDISRKTPYKRKTLQGSVKKVLHLAKSRVIDEGAENGVDDHEG